MKGFVSSPARPPSRGQRFEKQATSLESIVSNVQVPEDEDRHHHHHHHYSTDSLFSNLTPAKSLPAKTSSKIVCRCCGHLISLGFSPDEMMATQARALEQNAKLKAKLVYLKQEVDILQGQSSQLAIVLDRAQLQVILRNFCARVTCISMQIVGFWKRKIIITLHLMACFYIAYARIPSVAEGGDRVVAG
jgi:hypothetical protein